MPFELAVGTGIVPGTDEFGEDKGANGKGGRRARSGGMVVVAAGGNEGGGVVAAGEMNEGMAGTVEEQGLIDESTYPGEDKGKKALEKRLDDRWKVRKSGVGVRSWEW